MLLYADDIVLFCEDIDELNSILQVYDNTFSRFGLTIAIDKTKTLAFNVSEDVMNNKAVISLRNEPIENVRLFKYLGHVLCNESSKSSAFLNHHISSAYAKWNEMKSVFLDKRIFLSTRVKFLEACVRNLALFCTGLATRCQRYEEIRISLVQFFKVNGEMWFFQTKCSKK